MKPILQILQYIIQNNSWYQIPLRLLQAIYYQCYKRLSDNIVSKALFNGKRILLFPHNPICSAFVYTTIPDKKEILTLRSLADENTIFLDIGANVGAYSLLLMDKVARVFAFEAHPMSANYCKMNFLLNGANEQQVLQMAVSDSLSPKYFSNFMDGSPINKMVDTDANALSVAAITLDEFVHQQQFSQQANFLLKVDVEGFEHEVFQGGQKFLTSFPIKGIVFEALSTENQKAIILLEKLGYQIKMLAGNNMLALPSQ